jgi:HEAT repeat protein
MGQVRAEIDKPYSQESPGRWQSVVTLEKVGKPAVDYLLTLLKDPDKWVRYAAADTLGDIGDSASVGPLIRLLGDHDQEVRLASVQALEKIGDPGIRHPLDKAFRTDNGTVKISAEGAQPDIIH